MLKKVFFRENNFIIASSIAYFICSLHNF